VGKAYTNEVQRKRPCNKYFANTAMLLSDMLAKCEKKRLVFIPIVQVSAGVP
jgi:hypothetical protein